MKGFWDSDFISSQALTKTLVNPQKDDSSQTITRRHSQWIINSLNLKARQTVLVLGCYNSSYPSEFAKAGLNVTTIDSSRIIIEKAQKKAEIKSLPIKYHCKKFTEIDEINKYNLILLPDHGFGVYSDSDRGTLLNRIHHALKPSGFFAFNVWTNKKKNLLKTYKDWKIHLDGEFFSPSPHAELINHVHYEGHNICLDQHSIFDHLGNTYVYNFWDRYYTVKSLTALVNKFRFEEEKLVMDFNGEEYHEESETIALIVKKAQK